MITEAIICFYTHGKKQYLISKSVFCRHDLWFLFQNHFKNGISGEFWPKQFNELMLEHTLWTFAHTVFVHWVKFSIKMLEFCRSVYRLIWHWSNLTNLCNAKKLEQYLMKLQKAAELLSKNSKNCRLSWVPASVLVMISKIRTFCARYFMDFEGYFMGKLLVMQKDVCKCPNQSTIHIQKKQI